MPNPSARPTESELTILRMLWRRGPSTVREVMDEMAGEREMGYTTVLKFLQIMFEKRLVKRDEKGRTHIYEAAMPADKMRKRLLGEVLDKVFAGSVGNLVMQALGSKKVTQEELGAIRSLLDELEQKKGTRS